MSLDWFNGSWTGWCTYDSTGNRAPISIYNIQNGKGSGIAVNPFDWFVVTAQPIVCRLVNTGATAGYNATWTYNATASDYYTLRGTYRRDVITVNSPWDFGEFELKRVVTGGLPSAPGGGLPSAPGGGLPSAPGGGLPSAPGGGLPSAPGGGDNTRKD